MRQQVECEHWPLPIVKYHLILTKLLHLLSPLPCLGFITVSNKGASLWLVCCSSIFIRAPGAHSAALSFTRHRYSLSLISRLMVMAFDGLACREWVTVRPAGPVPFCTVLLTLFPFFVPMPLPRLLSRRAALPLTCHLCRRPLILTGRNFKL